MDSANDVKITTNAPNFLFLEAFFCDKKTRPDIQIPRKFTQRSKYYYEVLYVFFNFWEKNMDSYQNSTHIYF
jgi:hypothetical protein